MKIVIAEPLHIPDDELDADIARLLPDADVVRFDSRPADDAEYVERVKDADVIVVANMPLRAGVLARCPHLKLVSIAFVGFDHVDVGWCHDHGIAVANSPTYPTQAVAELVIGLTLAVLRKVRDGDRAVRGQGTNAGLAGGELHGRTVGIIGAGRIGQRTAELARAFGATTIGYNRSPKSIEGLELVPLEEVLRRADIVSLHVPLTPQTKHLLDRDRLALLKPGAVVINTARGPVVDTAALAEALRSGRIAAAGLDVFDAEPPLAPDDPILSAPNTVLTPHVGFDTVEALAYRAEQVLGNIRSWQQGRPENLV